jgi:hypothetical protein
MYKKLLSAAVLLRSKSYKSQLPDIPRRFLGIDATHKEKTKTDNNAK